MDIAKEILAFTDWLETNPLEPSTQTLWLHLMVIANKSGNPEWFAVANPLLQAKAGFSENTLAKHRNYLVQKGRIEYRSQGKQRAGKYRIIPFNEPSTSNNEVKPEVKHEVKPEVKRGPKGSALINNISSSSASSETGVYESFYAAHERVFGFGCNPGQAQILASYIDEDGMEEAVVIRAIERAAAASTGYNFRLIQKILDDYFKGGVRTLRQAEAVDAEFDARKNRRSAAQSQQDKASYFAEQARREREREQVGNLGVV